VFSVSISSVLRWCEDTRDTVSEALLDNWFFSWIGGAGDGDISFEAGRWEDLLNNVGC
jgi:hypothetical protein